MKDIKYLKDNNVDINQSLELFGDIETYNETLHEFQSSINGKLEQIEKYYNEEDMQNYAIYVHSLKSDCKYFGFLELASIAYEHEIKSKANDIKYVKENYNTLKNKANEIIKIVNEYLETPSNTNPTEDNSVNDDIILVADDSEVVRIFVKKIFNSNYEILSAKNGEETINIIREHEYDNKIKAILLDLNMPKVDGFAVLEYLSQTTKDNPLPTIIISGDSSKDAIEKAFKYDIVDMINKPFNEKKIKDVVEKALNQK